MKFLFLLKKNGAYGSYSTNSKAGLTNSARFLAEAIEYAFPEVSCALEVCADANQIDKYLHQHRPSICFIEAIWVEPAKFQELIRLHPRVKFVVRVHSCTPFLANEGMAIRWLKAYSTIPNVTVSFNHEETNNEYRNMLQPVYLPNVYDITKVWDGRKVEGNTSKWSKRKMDDHPHEINIGCFGAVRPLKNQLIQAVAAINFGDKYNKRVRFHINAERVEMAGENILKNMLALFEGSRHELVTYQWLDRPQFLKIISRMDVGMQVSFTETFNIVAADFIAEHVPIIVSPEISWMPTLAMADVVDTEAMVARIKDALQRRHFYVEKSMKALERYQSRAMEVWSGFISGIRVEIK